MISSCQRNIGKVDSTKGCSEVLVSIHPDPTRRALRKDLNVVNSADWLDVVLESLPCCVERKLHNVQISTTFSSYILQHYPVTGFWSHGHWILGCNISPSGCLVAPHPWGAHNPQLSWPRLREAAGRTAQTNSTRARGREREKDGYLLVRGYDLRLSTISQIKGSTQSSQNVCSAAQGGAPGQGGLTEGVLNLYRQNSPVR